MGGAAYRRGAAALAVVLVGSELTELVVSLVDTAAAGGGGGGGGGTTLAAAAAAAALNPGRRRRRRRALLWRSTPAIKWFHLVFEGATTIVTTIALGLIRLAPLRGPHPAELPAAQPAPSRRRPPRSSPAGDDEEEEAAAPRVPPQPPATTTLVQPLLAELPASLPATAPPPAAPPPAAAAVRGRLPRRAGARVRGAPSMEDAGLLLLLFVVLSSLASLCVLVASATRGVLSSGVQLEVLLLGRMLLFAHGIALFALFGTAGSSSTVVGVVHPRRAARLPSHLEHARARVSAPYSVQ